jgi:hypothetical protein
VSIDIRLQFLNIFRCKWTEENIDIEFTPGYSSTPENESRKHVLTPPMVDRTSLQTIIYDAILIALTRRGLLYLVLPITPCELTFPSLETSCKPLRRRERARRIIVLVFLRSLLCFSEAEFILISLISLSLTS